MKILVLSDSHGDVAAMTRAVRQFAPDLVLHLGDCLRDAMRLQEQSAPIPKEMVPGNCDFGTHAPETRILELGGVRILMTHGHRFQVKMSPLRAIYAAAEAQAQLLLYGHTHQALHTAQMGVQVLNPGSCGGPAGTCGIIEINEEDGSFRCALETIGGTTNDSSH